MLFFSRVRRTRREKPSAPETLPATVLLKSDWDDFSWKTTFELYYFGADGELAFTSNVKILQRGISATELPESFESLPDEFFSLGTSLSYYETVSQSEFGQEIFHALRDVVCEPLLAAEAAAIEGFKTSLLRFSEAEKAFWEAGRFFGRADVTPQGFEFSFSCQLDGFRGRHRVAIECKRQEADTHDVFPRRMMCFVGRNGTGKSGVLSRLAFALSGEDPDAGVFEPGRPRFSRTICLSYSVFQAFEMPTENSSSYRYLGFRGADGKIDADALTARTLDAIVKIMGGDRADAFKEYLSLTDVAGKELNLEKVLSRPDETKRFLATLSSGQRMVVSVAADVLDNIEEQSLILFDEPESYLHPTLLATLLRMLERALRKFDSYAIVATHSPIVVQEVPGRSVLVFERESAIPMIRSLSSESLGASLSEIVDQVFLLNADDKHYRQILRRLLDRYSGSVVRSLFDRDLSVNAELFVASLDSDSDE